MRIRVGCGEITWDGRGMSQDQILDDMARAGYDGAPWTLCSGWTAGAIEELFAERGLRAAPGFMWADLWDKSQWDGIFQRVREYADLSCALGVTELFVAANGQRLVTGGGRTRGEVAGHVRPEDSLSDDEFKLLAEGLSIVATLTADRGVTTCYHNHVGTVVESEDELERLLTLAGSDKVALGLDTGHLFWAGIDIVAFCRRHAGEVRAMHFKDIVASVRDRGVRAGWPYETFSENGLFTELGEGDVDHAGVLRVLEEADYDGWVIVETDVTRRSSPGASCAISRENLRKLGV